MTYCACGYAGDSIIHDRAASVFDHEFRAEPEPIPEPPPFVCSLELAKKVLKQELVSAGDPELGRVLSLTVLEGRAILEELESPAPTGADVEWALALLFQRMSVRDVARLLLDLTDADQERFRHAVMEGRIDVRATVRADPTDYSLCRCGHSGGSHNSLKFNCLATTDGTHATRCQCKAFLSASLP